MKTEIETLKEEIEVLERAYKLIETPSLIHEAEMEKRKSRLAALTAPSIRDGVLGRGYDPEDRPICIMTYGTWKRLYGNIAGCRIEWLTIEELLPTLAQWVPGAVRWRYGINGMVEIHDGHDWSWAIPAPPRDDWENCKGEL